MKIEKVTLTLAKAFVYQGIVEAMKGIVKPH